MYEIPKKKLNISKMNGICVYSNTYLQQTFTECVSNQYPDFDELICQI